MMITLYTVHLLSERTFPDLSNTGKKHAGTRGESTDKWKELTLFSLSYCKEFNPVQGEENGDSSRQSPHMRHGRDTASSHAQPTYFDWESPEGIQNLGYTATHSLGGTNTWVQLKPPAIFNFTFSLLGMLMPVCKSSNQTEGKSRESWVWEQPGLCLKNQTDKIRKIYLLRNTVKYIIPGILGSPNRSYLCGLSII